MMSRTTLMLLTMQASVLATVSRVPLSGSSSVSLVSLTELAVSLYSSSQEIFLIYFTKTMYNTNFF
jgi:hypothetical protein